MIGLGTIINTVAIIIGGLLGVTLKNAFPAQLQKPLISSIGVCTIFIGASGALKEMLTIKDGMLASNNSMMMLVICFLLGTTVGELINLEGRIAQFGDWLKRISKSEGDSSFLDGFLTASLTVCVGAMAVMGAIQDGLTGDYSMLAAKGMADGIIILIMATTMGKGCIFSAVPVFLVQGSITLLASFIQPLMTAAAISNLSIVGSILIFCVGINLIWGKTFRVANMMPSIIFAVIYALIFA